MIDENLYSAIFIKSVTMDVLQILPGLKIDDFSDFQDTAELALMAKRGTKV